MLNSPNTSLAKRRRGEDGQPIPRSPSTLTVDETVSGGLFGKVTVLDVLEVTREMWSRDNSENRSLGSEERDFRSMFGCGILVASKLWNILVRFGLLPERGELKHLMWTLCFLKTYAKSSALAKLCRGADAKTIRYWNWQFILALSNLEPHIVSFL